MTHTHAACSYYIFSSTIIGLIIAYAKQGTYEIDLVTHSLLTTSSPDRAICPVYVCVYSDSNFRTS